MNLYSFDLSSLYKQGELNSGMSLDCRKVTAP